MAEERGIHQGSAEPLSPQQPRPPLLSSPRMSRSVLQPSQQKLAEKLTILNDRGIGMLTRLYNIKKVRGPVCGVGGRAKPCGDSGPEARPAAGGERLAPMAYSASCGNFRPGFGKVLASRRPRARSIFRLLGGAREEKRRT